jgi:hypothetical protein
MTVLPFGYVLASIELRHDLQNRSAYITHGCESLSEDSLDPNSVAQEVLEAFLGPPGTPATGATLVRWMDTSVTIRSCTVRIGQGSGEALTGFVTSTRRGVSGHNSAPPNCAALLHKRTQRGGRRGRGRAFFPWVLDEATVNEAGQIESGWLANLQEGANNWLAALAASERDMVILHSEGVTSTGLPNTVTSIQVDPLIGTQRRRLGR